MHRLDPLDAVWLHMDHPTNLMMITAVLRFAGPLSRTGLRAVVEERLVAPYPRFSWRVVDEGGLGAPRWEPTGDLDLGAHLTFEDLGRSEVISGGPGRDEAALMARVGELMSSPLDPGRPLWHLHVLEGLLGPDGRETAALVARIHHSIADGMALARVLLGLSDEARHTVAPPRPHGLGPLLSRARGALRAARPLLEPDALRDGGAHLLHVAADATWELGHLLAMPRDEESALRGRLGVEKRAAWSTPVPLDRVRATARARGATINDVLMAAVAGALHRWTGVHGPRPETLRAFVPVDLRGARGLGGGKPVTAELGNHFSLVFLTLPVGEADPATRLARVKAEMDALKAGTEPLVTLGMLQATGRSPRPVEDRVVRLFGSKGSAILTNVPGPREALHIAGVEVDGIWFWVPQAGRVSLGISVFSYAGAVSVGVAGDAGRVPDPEVLAAAFDESLAELAAL